MSVRAIYEYPSTILQAKMPEVKFFGPPVHAMLKDLRDTLEQTGAAGLAANQIGVEASVCVILLGNGRVMEFINPVIIQTIGRTYSVEACLSLPDYVAIVPRAIDVKVGYKTRDGKAVSVSLAKDIAIRAQHEIDHLNGILIKDYVDGTNGKKGGITATQGVVA